MKFRKVTVSVLVAVILSVALSTFSFAVKLPEPTNDFFVNDFADVITDEDEEELLKIGSTLYKQTGAQVVVVTVDSLQGSDVKEYALYLGRKWGVGSKDENNGVVLLLSLKERQVAIQVGYGLEGCLTDAKTGIILDEFGVPYFKKNDFSEGLLESYKAIVSTVYGEYDVTPQVGYETDDYVTEENDDLTSIIVSVIIVIVLLIILSRGRGHFIMFGNPFGRGTFYGGGSGGRSSGGFSGGGGSFGGGGSSRGF